jgi:hypothetical protein
MSGSALIGLPASAKFPLGNSEKNYPSGRATSEVAPGLFLYVNQSAAQTLKAINKIASWLNVTVTVDQWGAAQ